MNETPLIFTSRGNVPIDSLRYEHRWTDGDDVLKLEEFWYAEDGELVKNNCHALAKRQLSICGEQAVMANHGRARLTRSEAREILSADGRQDDIARRFGVSQTTVSQIKSGQRWKHLQFQTA